MYPLFYLSNGGGNRWLQAHHRLHSKPNKGFYGCIIRLLTDFHNADKEKGRKQMFYRKYSQFVPNLIPVNQGFHFDAPI